MDRFMFCDQLCTVMYMMLIFGWDDGFVMVVKHEVSLGSEFLSMQTV